MTADNQFVRDRVTVHTDAIMKLLDNTLEELEEEKMECACLRGEINKLLREAARLRRALNREAVEA